MDEEREQAICQKKRKFLREMDAKAVLPELIGLGVPLYPYKCAWCPFWHVSRNPHRYPKPARP